MIVVADASVLVAELLRVRGRALLRHTGLQVVVAEEQWSETQHELERRIAVIVERGRLSAAQARAMCDDARLVVASRVVEVQSRSGNHIPESHCRRSVFRPRS